MNLENNYLDYTVGYYNSASAELIRAYETANMSELHTFLFSNLSPKSKVLDIGFGSGRDLAFLHGNGFDIWGIDPAQKFVDHAKWRFPAISNHFYTTSLPHLDIPKELLHTFDTVIVIAVWMHLPINMYEDSIKSLCSLLKPGGKVILSYSITPRTEETERYFEDVNRNMLQTLFGKCGCTKINAAKNKDGLGERDITWVTEAYGYDKF